MSEYFFHGVTGNTANARAMAQASIYQQLNQQASVLGYQDIYRVLAWVSLLLVAFGFLLSKKPSRARAHPPELSTDRAFSLEKEHPSRRDRRIWGGAFYAIRTISCPPARTSFSAA